MARNQSYGFTLIELMITVAVAAILLTIAVPSFQEIIVANRITTQTNELVSDFALARSEAIKRGARVAICTANSSAACSGAGTNWAGGRLVFVDANSDADFNAGETALRFTEAFTGGLTLISAGSITSSFSYISAGNVTTAGKFRVCKTGFTGRVVTITNTGRVSTVNTSAVC